MAEYLIPDTVNRQVAIAEHPDYAEQSRLLRFGRENYEGSGGYSPYVEDVTIQDTQPDDEKAGTYTLDKERRTHLFRHPREKEKFSRRVVMAYLTNVIKRCLSMLLGFLTKAQPQYDDYPDAVKKWMSQVNAAGDNWEQFKEHEILPPLGYYGWLPTIFYKPPTPGAETVAQQEAAGGQLTVEVINPECIIDWLYRPDGSFEWFKVKTEVDTTGPLDGARKTIDRYTWYTPAGWYSVDDDKRKSELPVVDSGPYANGLPVVIWRLRGGAITADANAVQREMYNVNSLIQEQERGTAFAMLRSPAQGESDRIMTVGTDNVWWFPADARHAPEWMAPPPHVLEHLMAKRAALAAEIMENMGLDFDQGGGQTGMAFQFKMSKIVRLLQGLSNSLSRGETGSLKRVALEIGVPLDDNVRCVWPSEFDAKDVEKVLDGLERILDRSKSTKAKARADYQMCAAALGDLDEKFRKEIRQEVEDGWDKAELDAENMSALADHGEPPPPPNAPKPGPFGATNNEAPQDIQANGGAR